VIVHLLKLVWHRKRTNALVMAEIFLSFLIVFAIVTMTVSLVSRWRTPLGFDWRNVWTIEIDNVLVGTKTSTTSDGLPTDTAPDEKAEILARLEATDRVIRALRSFPEIEGAAADAMTPYSDNGWNGALSIDGRRVEINVDRATDDFARVMRMPVVSGRWFSREDDGQNYEPVVIDTNAARAMFNEPAPIGRTFASDNFIGEGNRKMRVVGVIAPFRKDGEFSDQNLNMMFLRTSFGRPEHPLSDRVVIRVRPGTPGSFEAALNDRLHRVVPVTFRIKRMEDMRNTALKMRFVPIAILTVVALFLISMVALGLTGVLWQTVTRRMREMGLRRAMGATGRGVRTQVLGEVTVLSTLSVILGAIVVLQLPLLGIFQAVKPAEFTTGFIAAIAVIYAITLACGGYPSWLASRIEPADALRYE
jgi:putative ABC transport system permease protein